MSLGMCACARTREYCVTQGCKRDDFVWRYSTEGRKQDDLRRVVDLRARLRHEAGSPSDPRPVSRWIRPERAVAEAWLMNMEARPGVSFIEKLGPFLLSTEGVPGTGHKYHNPLSTATIFPTLRYVTSWQGSKNHIVREGHPASGQGVEVALCGVHFRTRNPLWQNQPLDQSKKLQLHPRDMVGMCRTCENIYTKADQESPTDI